jgi:hypothetical protein
MDRGLPNWQNTKDIPSVMFLKILVSSANRYTSDFTPSGKSLMNSMNNKGPNTESCGIPDVTSFQHKGYQLMDQHLIGKK